MLDSVPEGDPARRDLAHPTADSDQVVVASRLAIAYVNVAHHQSEPRLLQLTVGDAGTPQQLAARDVEPDQVPRVIDQAHLIGLGIVHPNQTLGDAGPPDNFGLSLPAHLDLGMFPPVLGETLVVVSDAHLGYAPPAVEAALLEFLDAVPTFGDCLLVNGDLFEFWFAYRRVLPRRGFRVVAALGHLARRLPIIMVGGNHDRWGEPFWQQDLGIRFERERAEFAIGKRRVLALHGDGIAYGRPRSRVLHRLVSHPLASLIYRAIHPELAIPFVHYLAAHLGDHATEGAVVDHGVERQLAWATRTLRDHPSLGLVIAGHTHRPVLEEPAPGRQYLNPGAWFDGFRYAIATESDAQLRRFTPSGRLPLAPVDPR